MMANAEAVPVERLLPYVRELNAPARAAFLRARTGVPQRWGAPVSKAERPPLTPRLRGLVLEALGDASPDVRHVAFEALEGSPVLKDEIARLTDPEASASTVEMRAALVRETCAALSLTTVEVKGHHAIVRGELASYAVHLGSANATVLPGTALLIVAVHSQHRGRLFLPFADDDPKTAEVMSKVLLLARDRQIKDAGILDQIRMTARG